MPLGLVQVEVDSGVGVAVFCHAALHAQVSLQSPCLTPYFPSSPIPKLDLLLTRSIFCSSISSSLLIPMTSCSGLKFILKVPRSGSPFLGTFKMKAQSCMVMVPFDLKRPRLWRHDSPPGGPPAPMVMGAVGVK